MALFWRHVLTEDEKKRLVANIAGHLKGASEFIQRRAVRNFTQVDPEYGGGIARLLLQYKNKVGVCWGALLISVFQAVISLLRECTPVHTVRWGALHCT